MSEIPHIPEDAPTEAAGWQDFKLLAKSSAGFLVASTALCGSVYYAVDTFNSLETVYGVEGKRNPCAKDRQQADCLTMMQNPSVTIVYPANGGIKVKPLVKFVERALPAVTGGESDPIVRAVEIGGKVGKLMTLDACLPTAESGDKDTAPLSVQAAKQESSINDSDFVVAIIPRDYCDSTNEGQGIGGLAYQGYYGNRFSEIYKVDDSFRDQQYINYEYGTRIIHELIGHSMFGLDHDHGVQSIKGRRARTAVGTKHVYDLDKTVAASTLHEYGGNDSVMGSGVIMTDSAYDEAKEMFNPMELEDMSAANGITQIDFEGTGSIAIPAGGEKTYISVKNKQQYETYDVHGMIQTFDGDELLFYVDDLIGRFKYISVYARSHDNAKDQTLVQLASMEFNFFKNSDQVMFRDEIGQARIMSIERRAGQFEFTLSHTD